MDYPQLFSAIDSLQAEYIRFWEDICTIESPTTYKPGVDAVAEFCVRQAEKYGWQVEVRPEEVSGNAVCITMNPDAAGQPVALSGHMDTVHPVGCFGSPAVHTDETYIYGPGVADCKGGIVASFLVMAALQQCGYTDRPVKLILQSDEENSSCTSNKDTVAFMEEKSRDCAVFLNTEAHRGAATLWRKGLSKYRLDITGVAAHASACARFGSSAIREAAMKIIQIEEQKDHDGITMNCGTIQGGSAINTVPEECNFTVDVRYATMDQMKEAHEFLTRVAATNFVDGCTTELVLLSSRPSMDKADRNFAILEKMNAIYAEAGMPTLEAVGAPGGSDTADLTARGITCVDSLGVEGDFIHSIREKAELASLARSAKRLGAVIIGLK